MKGVGTAKGRGTAPVGWGHGRTRTRTRTPGQNGEGLGGALVRWLGCCLACLLAMTATLLGGATRPAQAREGAPAAMGQGEVATFAIIIGVNKSVDPELPILRYADDDAVRYRELFSALGAHSYLLTRLDENTQRLAPEAARRAWPPRRVELGEAVTALGLEVAAARARGARTTFYFVYAGHGNVADEPRGGGTDRAWLKRNGDAAYLALEDARVSAEDLEHAVIDRVGADETHLIVDACYSYFLAYGRGPGGSRREIHGFVPNAGLAQRADVGLLLSTTSARQSHEWEGFQAGIFSHEVRSGLFGAADFDGDGQISYKEIASFVARANAPIANERFRPDVYSHPPHTGDHLMDLRGKNSRVLRLEAGAPVAHYLLEDARGVRLADFHNATGHPSWVLLPRGLGILYLRRLSDEQEFPIGEETGNEVALRSLVATPPRIAARGAANDAFNLIFSLPFDESALMMSTAGSSATAPTDVADAVSFEDRDAVDAARRRRMLGWTGMGVGAASLAVAAGFSVAALNAWFDAHHESQTAIDADNQRVRGRSAWAWTAGGVGGAALLAGGWLLWSPLDRVHLTAELGGSGNSLAIAGRF